MAAMGIGRRALSLALASAMALAVPAARADDDERLAAQVERIDARFMKALGTLAQECDKAKDPEAAHFFAECALGFGLKDPKIAVIKGAYEIDLYVGKLRGGVVLKAVNPIKRELEGPAKEYRKIYDALMLASRGGPMAAARALTGAEKRVLHDVAVKVEIAQGAQDYVQAIQRFNEIRRAMGLRAILWEFESSRKLILAGAYMGETGDYKSKGILGNDSGDDPKKDNVFYGDSVDYAKDKSARLLGAQLSGVMDRIRETALVREDLLNLDARRLWLGRWSEGRKIPGLCLYSIPAIEYRSDVPTPSKRYTTDTLAQEHGGWVDTEETVSLNGKKVPFVRYPYDGEKDAPFKFNDEYGWAESQGAFLAKAGVPIMIRFFGKCTIAEVATSLKDSSGREVPLRVYKDGDSRVQFHLPWPTLLLVPERELEKDTKYTVTVTCTLDGTPFERTWSFTTRSK